MALEIFALVGKDGESAGQDHIFTGTRADFTKIAALLDEAFAANRRVKAPRELAARFRQAADGAVPLVRLDRRECRQLVGAITILAEGKKKTLYVSKLSDRLGEQLLIY